MTGLWQLPERAVIGGRSYAIHGDFRDILEIFSYFTDPDLPEYVQWAIAVALFYEGDIPRQHQLEAMEYLLWFINCGAEQEPAPGPKLLDWEQDAPWIVADVNKVAGQEIRQLPFLHWWTFMAYFHAIGEGQLSTVVAIRDKLARGKKLEDWEQTFYKENKKRVDMAKRYSRQELEQRRKLQQMLEGSERAGE